MSHMNQSCRSELVMCEQDTQTDTRMHKHTHTHTHTRIRTHTYTQTHKHTHKRTHTQSICLQQAVVAVWRGKGAAREQPPQVLRCVCVYVYAYVLCGKGASREQPSQVSRCVYMGLGVEVCACECAVMAWKRVLRESNLRKSLGL